MSIYNVGQMNSAFKNYNTANWSKSVELGKKMDFSSEFNELKPDAGSTKSFGEFLADSISKVNQLEHDSDVAMQKLASGESKNLHETLLAAERADIAFKQMNQVRMKVIDAYREIMKMQV